MKILSLIVALSLIACGENSSPEGRLSIKIDKIQKEIESLKKQNETILDSLDKIKSELRELKE